MNRCLRRFFVVLALVFAVLGVTLVAYLHALGLSLRWSKGLWAFLLLAVGAGAIAWRGKPGLNLRVFLILCGWAMVEMMLQSSAWLGILPAVNTKERLPWGRVYWTSEGQGNSIRNRYGWHFPEFDLAQTNRTAVIGDSFVEAVEVHRTKNMAAQLATILKAQHEDVSILGLGNHGTGPAHYLEVLRYAHRRFAIREAVIVLYLGNDLTDCSPRLQFHDPNQFIYYSLAPDGKLTQDTAGTRARILFEEGLEVLHRPAWLFLPRLAASHCMSVQVPLSVRNTMAMRSRMRMDLAHNAGFEADAARLGLKAEPFALQPSPAAREAAAILKALLGQAAEYAQTNDIRLCLVTVPFFPQDFYAFTGTNWSGQLGDYDFLGPERELARWADQLKIPMLALGQEMKRLQLTTEQVRALYLSRGSGHFSAAGHQLAAEAMQRRFHPGRERKAGSP